MARFISLSLVVVCFVNSLLFAQKHVPIPVRLLLQETTLIATPWNSPNSDITFDVPEYTRVSMHVYANPSSNYLVVEVLGSTQVMEFRIVTAQGEEMYSGTIRGTQMIETETWPAGTYYFVCGSRMEPIHLSK
jgi:hypothetical protein